MSSLADRIDEAVQRSGLSASAVALKAGLSRPSISNMTRQLRKGGKATITVETAEAIARAAGVDPAWMTFGVVRPAEGLLERIERLHETLSRWEDGCNFRVSRIKRGDDGAEYCAQSETKGSVWQAELFENGVDGAECTGEGPTSDAALADLLEKLRAKARERMAAIEAATREGVLPVGGAR